MHRVLVAWKHRRAHDGREHCVAESIEKANFDNGLAKHIQTSSFEVQVEHSRIEGFLHRQAIKNVCVEEATLTPAQ